MFDDRCSSSNYCSCQTRACVNRVLAILAIVLALVVGAIFGAMMVTMVVEALIPLAIFAIGLLLAIILIYLFVRCRCREEE